MGAFATGVAIVTARDAGTCFGMTVNSLTSVSLDPCLLPICPKRGSATGNAIKSSGMFAVNLLNKSQKQLASHFVGQASDRFSGVDIDMSPHGLPVLRDALSHFECIVSDVHAGGDHDIIVGEVVSCVGRDGPPLVFFRGAFGNYTAENGDL
jgi:3-hydroxy-9,10-secoandrosta-1,3,5(10)-triene-9,17-dione monooxygenase reductase component